VIRIEVDPGWLGTAAAEHAMLGDSFAGLGAGLSDVSGEAVAAAGDASLGRGIGAATGQLDTGVQSLVAEMRGLASALDAAGRAYAATDESAMPEPS
jgi:hypothetical protein